MAREAYNIPETAEILGIGENQVYEGVKRKEIPSIRIGRRIVIPKAALHKMLEQGVPPKAA